MSTRGYILLLGAGLLAVASAARLSDYVTPCQAKDPKLNECMQRAAQDVFNKIGKGIPELGLRPLDPVQVPKLELARQGALNMNLAFTNSTHYGLGDAKVKRASVDLEHHSYNFTILIPKYTITGTYDINGRVILLPIRGHGLSTTTFTDIEGDWCFVGEEEKRDGKHHLKLKSLKSNIISNSPKNVQINFEGLFGGNKVLGDTMNDFLNTNWKELVKQLKPSVTATFDTRILPVAQRFISHFPLNELFSDL